MYEEAGKSEEKKSFVDKLKQWVNETWGYIKDTMSPWSREESGKISLQDFINMPLSDLVKGVNPREVMKEIMKEKTSIGEMLNEMKETSPKLSATDKSAQDFKGNVSTVKIVINRNNRPDAVDNLEKINNTISNSNEKQESHIFLDNIKGAMLLDISSNSGYIRVDIDGEPHTLRISNHSINAKNNTKQSEKKNFESVVIKVGKRSHFNSSDDVELTEYVYYPKLLTKEKEQAIIKGLTDWLYSGEYSAEADRVNVSPKEEIAEIQGRYDRDVEYKKAVESGDMATSKRLLEDEAKRKGYSDTSEYQGTSAFNGAAPSRNEEYESEAEKHEAIVSREYEGDVSMADAIDNPDAFALNDEINAQMLSYHQRRDEKFHVESINAIRAAREKYLNGNKNATITMYRSVPSGVKETKFRNGDWITPSKSYAIENAEIHSGYEGGNNAVSWDENGTANIIKMEVPIKDVWWDENDINEWGYDNGKGEVYKNTPNNRKTFDITYDDKGKLIPLSERFNENNSDARFRFIGEKGTKLDGKSETVQMDKKSSRLSDEEREIIDDSMRDGTYMKAPNGKLSNLSEKQWAQHRTKSFKDWFGDWEKTFKKKFLLESDVVSSLSGNEFLKQEGKSLTDQVSDFFDSIGGKAVSPIFGDVVLDRKGADDSLGHGMSRLKAIAYKSVPDVIKNGELLESDYNHKERGYDSHIVAAPIEINGERYICSVVVTSKNGNNRFYLHEVIKQKELLNEGSNQGQSQAQRPKAFAKILQNVVFSNNSSKILDENGEPLEVNHATDEEFSTFDKDKLGAETDGNATNVGLAATSHIGFWFNNTDNILSDFHSNKMNTYLNIRNPKEYSSLEELVADMDNGNGNGNSKEVLDDIQGVLDKMHIVINRIKLNQTRILQ